ncbi:hypothetical protein [Bacillus sp. V5-8f]|uniref:hypothetical protein n=1 Tax=Bacillus sp. V5-8f TaxID=2053044 RepID=UPI000C774268|nr:hypothetical protein [Bacillus sp. V5-8f]PLT31969.1 hypothetical protein CUU64_20495 [Bacillus sp. V5-8f]
MAALNNTQAYTYKTAKLDRDIMHKIGVNHVNLSSNAINFILFVANCIDGADGRIYVDRDKIRRELHMQKKTLIRVIQELKDKELLSEKNGFLVSHFHVTTNGETGQLRYMKNLKKFNSSEVFSMKKNAKRLLLKIAAMGTVGLPKRTSVENLYSNKLHDEQFGVFYHDSYQEFSANLFQLIEKDLIHVGIGKNTLTKDTEGYKEKFHEYCEFDAENGKVRTKSLSKHPISLKINHDLSKARKEKSFEALKNVANEEEFKFFASQYQICWELLRPETIPYFIGMKKELIARLGLLGLEIYRKSLIKYFAEHQENVLYHDLIIDEDETKAANYMKDFYILEEIKKIIVETFVSSRSNKDSLLSSEQRDELIRFFYDKGSVNHKIKLDEELTGLNSENISLYSEVLETNIKDLPGHLKPFNVLFKDIQLIYQSIPLVGESDINTHKIMVRKLAEQNLLTNKVKLQEAVNELKSKVSFISGRYPNPYNNLTQVIQTDELGYLEKLKGTRKASPLKVEIPDWILKVD